MVVRTNIVTSSNWDVGRAGNKVTGIVLHTMVGTMAGSQARFNDPSSQVSVHYGIGLDGSIRRWVDEANTAWQAGDWQTNLTTIGLEHEDAGNANDSVRTAALYESSSDLVADICRRYNFPADTNHIFLHKNVIDKAEYPGGTACPDALDTNKIITMAASKLKASIAKGEEVMDEQTVKAIYHGTLHRDPESETAWQAWVGKRAFDFLNQVIGSSEWKNQNGILLDAYPKLQKQAASQGTPLKPGVYVVQ